MSVLIAGVLISISTSDSLDVGLSIVVAIHFIKTLFLAYFFASTFGLLTFSFSSSIFFSETTVAVMEPAGAEIYHF
jgi:hypothetical protein